MIVAPRLCRLWLNAKYLEKGFAQLRCFHAGRPLDNDGQPLPWYTYPAIEYLKQFDFSDIDVFEFGSGYSSLFWALKAKSVCSVEHDAAWFSEVEKKCYSNQKIALRSDRDAYVQALFDQSQHFQLIVIDGKWRRSCAEAAVQRITDDGIIILDNSDWFPHAAGVLRKQGFFQIDFSGLGPINTYAWTTSLFVRSSCTLQAVFRDPTPAGGIQQYAADDI